MDRTFVMNVHRAIGTQLDQLTKANKPEEVNKWMEQLQASMQVIQSQYPTFATAEVNEVLEAIKKAQLADAQRKDVESRATTLLNSLKKHFDYEEWASPKYVRLRELEEALMNAENNEALKEAVHGITEVLNEMKEEFAEFSPGIREDVLGIARGVLAADVTRTNLKEILDRFIQELEDLIPERKFWKQNFNNLSTLNNQMMRRRFDVGTCPLAIENILKDIQKEKPDFAEELIHTAIQTVHALNTADATRQQVSSIITELIHVIEKHINQQMVGTCQSEMAFCNGTNRNAGING